MKNNRAIMNFENRWLDSSENHDCFRSIEVPEEEIKVLVSIADFAHQLSVQEHKDFGGSIFYPEGTREKIQELFQEKIAELKQKEGSLTAEEKENLGFRARREAEYEACSDVIDYKNKQLEMLIGFIESQVIWKTKLSTASNVDYSKYLHETFDDFVDALEKSEELHEKNSFASQNFNSLYYISNSGISLRINISALHSNGGIQAVIQPLEELSICFNDTIDRDDQGMETTRDSIAFPREIISFDPKIGYRVEEFGTNDFEEHHEGNFISKIEIKKEENRIVISNFERSHSGHCINKIYF
jgi:hypothetical protein